MAKPMPLMQSALPSMPFVFEIKSVCGSRHGPFCKSLPRLVPFAKGFFAFASKRSGVPVQQPIQEQQGFVEKSLQKQLAKTCQASLKAINTDLASAEKQINELIQSDDRLKELFGWITSVPGVGDAIATEVLVATNEFKAINDPKKLACHAGVAPFEYRSGSRVRSKTRVSQHARLRLKSLFHLGALSAVGMKGELQAYYQRKVGEGKIGSPKRQNECVKRCSK